jgi:PAS domain-containing protein
VTRTLHYRQLFEAMSEGFALVEAIRDAEGRLTDYTILKINPALQRMLGVGPNVVGTRLTQGGQPDPRWLKACDTVLRSGQHLSWDFHDEAAGLWQSGAGAHFMITVPATRWRSRSHKPAGAAVILSETGERPCNRA